MGEGTRGWAVVLGASSGTGASVVKAAAEAGFSVFGMHRGNYQEAADALCAELDRPDRRVVLHVGDAGHADGAAEGAGALQELLGQERVRLVVHSIANASIGRFTGQEGQRFHPKQFAKTFEGMAHSFVYWTQQLHTRGLLAQPANIVALSNPFADGISDGFGMVSATKAALEVYVRHLAYELGPEGHRVNMVKFGLVETPAVRMAFPGEAWEHAKRRIRAVTPGGELCTTDEVARFLVQLPDQDLRWFNGATIDFTGGQGSSLLTYLMRHR